MWLRSMNEAHGGSHIFRSVKRSSFNKVMEKADAERLSDVFDGEWKAENGI